MEQSNKTENVETIHSSRQHIISLHTATNIDKIQQHKTFKQKKLTPIEQVKRRIKEQFISTCIATWSH